MHFQQLDFLITTTAYYQISYKRIYSKCDFTHDTKYAQPIDRRFHEFHPKSPRKETNQGAQSVADGLSELAYNRRGFLADDSIPLLSGRWRDDTIMSIPY